jgi:hypothetical protein
MCCFKRCGNNEHYFHKQNKCHQGTNNKHIGGCTDINTCLHYSNINDIFNEDVVQKPTYSPNCITPDNVTLDINGKGYQLKHWSPLDYKIGGRGGDGKRFQKDPLSERTLREIDNLSNELCAYECSQDDDCKGFYKWYRTIGHFDSRKNKCILLNDIGTGEVTEDPTKVSFSWEKIPASTVEPIPTTTPRSTTPG